MTAPAVASGTVAGSSVAAASAARGVQLAVRAALLRDVIRLWPALNPKRLDETFPGWLSAMIALTTSYHGQSAQAAAAYYRAARAAAIQSPTPRSLIRLAPAPGDEWMGKAFGFSGPGMLSRDTVRPNTALTTTLGTASRIALDGGRTTILDTTEHDPVAVGWYRVTDGHPCSFCALLASRPVIGGRGSAYRTEKTASFQAHNHCGCTAAPMFDHDQPLPAINQQAAQVYRQRGKGNAVTAFRAAWDQHLTATN